MQGLAQDILLVEDNPGDARLIRELLIDEVGREGFRMRDARTLAEALQRIVEQRPDMVVLDLSLPDSFGLETLFRIQSHDALLPIIVLTGNEDRAVALAAVKAGAQDFLVKQDLSGRLLVKTLEYARERKHNETRLRVSEARFRSLAELSSDWYWEQDTEHRLTYLSDGLLEKSGVDPAALLGRGWHEAASGGAVAAWATLHSALASRQPFQDFVFRHASDGAEALHISISGVPVFDNGAFAGYRGLGEDVSSRERAAAHLRGSEERFRQMLDTGRDGVLMLAADGAISFCNRRAASLLGAEATELLGRRLDDMLVREASSIVPAKDPQEERGAALRRADGSTVSVMESLYPMTGLDGAHAGTLAILTDLTVHKQREERVHELAALAAQKSEAERVSHAKSRFMAAVSHDLRQPMHALGLFIDDLKCAKLPKHVYPVLDHMESALHSTQSLLDSILIMSRLETGMIAPNFMAFPLEPLLARLRSAFGLAARQKNVRFVVASSPLTVYSDPALLERVMTNLVSNALRYTDKGGVIVACRPSGRDVRLEVWDSGIGIPAEHQEAVFREFYRIERSEGDQGALGLGLAIVRSCTQLLGCPVQLRSVPGRGSRFSLRVPLSEARQELSVSAQVQPPDDSTGARFDGLRVLLIDDDALILEGTRKLLERWGCHVMSALTGSQADAVLAHEAVLPDLVISDLRLDAGELGTEIVARIRSRYRPGLPAVLVSGDTSLQTARFVRQHGLPLLYKPVAPVRLRAVIAKLCGG
ncbi:Aerobic respiration control sensor protein ArcB [Variovorax sp. PBL-H6]|uniref:response regulator n=1 Tax=Variovorax sp. PBL-H6 TaxID=434009 RepID=UPI001315FD7D|nr:response regulator [Variovorax sp. PBL-H6]VTU22892.1 Aerobic respiration control sensor protein ArcB [Variovorax sp. PBL-H6]